MAAHDGTEARTSAILVVQARNDMANAVSGVIRAEGFAPLNAPTLAAARRYLHDSMRGMIVEAELPDGNGLELILEARVRCPRLPIMVLMSPDASGNVNVIRIPNAASVDQPNIQANVLSFVRSCADQTEAHVSELIDELERRYRLRAAERRLILLAMMTSTRERIAEHLGVSVNTVKKQIASLLAKTNARTLEELVAPLRARSLRW